MDPIADQPAPATDPAQLPALFQQLITDLAAPAVTYLLGGHYYDRTNHPRYRHFPAVFALRQGEVDNVEVGPDFVAFDTELVRYPDRGERHYPGTWADRFRATVPFDQLYNSAAKNSRLPSKRRTKLATAPTPLFILTQTSISGTPPRLILTRPMRRLPLLENTRW